MKKLLIITSVVLSVGHTIYGVFDKIEKQSKEVSIDHIDITDGGGGIDIYQDQKDLEEQLKSKLISKSVEFTEKVRTLLFEKENMLPANIDIKTSKITFQTAPFVRDALQILFNKKPSNLFVIVENGDPASITDREAVYKISGLY